VRRRNSILATAGFGLSLSSFLAMPCYAAFDGRVTSKDGNLLVTYHVAEGYKISIRIDTKKRRAAYSESLQADVFSIKIDFFDVNRDGFEDVIIKYADETGYSPAILINQGDLSFVNALRNSKELLYVNTELNVKEDGKAARGVEYQLKDVTGDGVPELIFYNAFVGKNGYRSVVLRFESKTTSYLLHRKGDLFEQRE